MALETDRAKISAGLIQADFDQLARFRRAVYKSAEASPSGAHRDKLFVGLDVFDKLVRHARGVYDSPDSALPLPKHIEQVITEAQGRRVSQLQLLDSLRANWPKYRDHPKFAAWVGVTCKRLREQPPLWLDFDRGWDGRWEYWAKNVVPVDKMNIPEATGPTLDESPLHQQIMWCLHDQFYKRRATFSELKRKLGRLYPRYRKRKYFDKELKEALVIARREELKFGCARRKSDRKKVYWHRMYDPEFRKNDTIPLEG